ncbi:hypothetical protein [Cellulophaga sp. 20_2_10]|uniref:hypothetical protein n=1 Tax=Cellulophaga sp. 20_2_10 TaxID=2942476 RepID=UPI00201AB1A3|nr:hypothetical protein [Cellulophaga sp. 20_2_10]
MSDRMENCNENLGRYPIDLNELIGDNPTRQGRRKDAWNRVYKFAMTQNGKDFLITPAGPDEKFETEDDIISK